jgi:hypothetical protein
MSYVAYSQSIDVSVPWSKSLQITENNVELTIPAIENGGYENGLPYFSFKQVIKKGDYQFQLDILETAPCLPEDLALIARYGQGISNQPVYVLKEIKDQSKTELALGLLPYIRTSAGYERIVSVRISYQLMQTSPVAIEKDYATTSVLGSGTWYKISINQDGIYKLDKAFFEKLGISIESLNPQSINIYGNGSGKLSELNSAPYQDDLIKNAIVAVGESDGVFNVSDYFLFYGAGPNRWDYSSTAGFNRTQHIYSTVSCYFIHIDDNDPALRMQSISDESTVENQLVTSYSYFDIHELETYNLVKAGQRWYGELFDGELTQSFAFSVPDIVSGSNLTVDYAVASSATSFGNNFHFKYNGSLVKVQSLAVAANDFAYNTGQFSITPNSSAITFDVTLNRVNASVKGYLDFIKIQGRRSLNFSSGQYKFRDLVSVGAGNVSKFTITGMNASTFIWDITNVTTPLQVNGVLTNGAFSFKQKTDSLREFIVFNSASYLTPSIVGFVVNQNIHALESKDLVIVTHPDFLGQAQRLASLHEENGTSAHVFTTTDVYNEFSSGMQDATAIRRMMKMFYDRANGDVALQPKYLLLFGDVTYDPKNRVGDNNYFVPTYEVVASEDHIEAIVTDDYFGLLDNNSSIAGTDMMRIAVGRLLISNNEQAVQQVNKIEHYLKNGSTFYSGGINDCCSGETNSGFGDWRLNYTLIADDEENAYFIKVDTEPAAAAVYDQNPEMNCDKIYCDAYVQTSSAGGERYPDVFNAITDRVQRGSLVVNYVGHGGEVGAAEERIITIPQIQSWTNINKLGLFVTATCEFTKFDDPSRVSAGEWISLNPTGGAIALMTTSRSVYFGVNSNIINAFYAHVFERDANHEAMTFGEIMRLTKNTSDFSNNRRSFNLIGDPALKIALPRYTIVTDSINGFNPLLQMDTIRALSRMVVKGHLADENGQIMTSFNGVISPTIFDKPKLNHTLKNDPKSEFLDFYTQKNALYKGKASVKNGYFEFEFIVPKDIDFHYGRGKMSYYAENTLIDASGLDTNLIIGGLNTNAALDTEGPSMNVYLNDNNFVNGGTTSSQPLLIIETADAFGINTVGNGVGHDLIAILDGTTAEPIVLNDYFTGDLDSYQSGKIRYTLKGLTPGEHTIEIKVWDVNNNSSTEKLSFVVVNESETALAHVLNYPNPFTTKTSFFFEHNQSCATLETQIQIYTVAGRLVKTINQTVPTAGFRIAGIEWDGTDDFGDALAKGVYVYRVTIDLPGGVKAEKVEKLVLLR